MTDRPHQSLVDALAEIISDPDEARRVAVRGGFPRKDLPAFKTARQFWERVVEGIVDGKTKDGIGALAAEAAELYPGNEMFASYRTETARDACLGERSPRAPVTSRFGGMDFRGATIGHQIIVQGDATIGSVGSGGGTTASSESPRPWLPWPRSQRARRGLALLVGGLAITFAASVVNPNARRSVCNMPGVRTLCPEEPTEAEEALWQRALEVGPSDGLKEYLSAYPRGFHVEEARARLDGCRIEERIEWEDDSVSLEKRPVLPRAEPYATEADARHDALERAQEDAAKNACIPYETSALFRLRATSFEPTNWVCLPRGEGHTCTVHGHPVCVVQRRRTVETEICNEARD